MGGASSHVIALVALGSRGDVQPFVALGAALRERGHQVRLATSEEFRPLAVEAGLEFRALLGASPQDFFADPDFTEVLRTTTSPAKISAAMPKPGPEQRERTLSEVRAATRDADLVVHTPHTRAAALITPGTHWCCASAWPVTPTATMPAFGFPVLPFGGFYHRLTYRLLAQGEWRFFRAAVQKLRAAEGLEPLGPRAPRYCDDPHRPVLYPFSRHVFPVPADWPPSCQVTGYWFWNRHRQPSADLAAFVEDGPPPIAAAFGSTWMIDEQRSVRALLQAARRTGTRVVMMDGPQEDLPGTVFRAHDVDYGWLFPRTSAVIHHGGQGTAAAALRAGVPQVVVPSFADQPYWARRLAALGVAAEPIPYPELGGDRLAAALAGVMADDAVAARARQLGEAVRSERGVESACEVVERWAGRRAVSGVAL
ncbi:MAG: glycosyltransferase [Pseudonocardiaceae bacterium]